MRRRELQRGTQPSVIERPSRRRAAASSPFRQEMPEPEVEAFRAAVIIVGRNDQYLVVPAHDHEVLAPHAPRLERGEREIP